MFTQVVDDEFTLRVHGTLVELGLSAYAGEIAVRISALHQESLRVFAEQLDRLREPDERDYETLYHYGRHVGSNLAVQRMRRLLDELIPPSDDGAPGLHA